MSELFHVESGGMKEISECLFHVQSLKSKLHEFKIWSKLHEFNIWSELHVESFKNEFQLHNSRSEYHDLIYNSNFIIWVTSRLEHEETTSKINAHRRLQETMKFKNPKVWAKFKKMEERSSKDKGNLMSIKGGVNLKSSYLRAKKQLQVSLHEGEFSLYALIKPIYQVYLILACLFCRGWRKK